ncbi:MAG: hypothetical protein Kow0065_04060 [Methylomicrobium sp.]
MTIVERLAGKNLTFHPGALALMLLMAATRSSHIGTPFQLPDATLAVFFLGGLWFGGLRFFVLLLTEAVLIDFVAISFFSVSDFCVSPAYVFLLPAYAALWFAGKSCARIEAQTLKTLSIQFVVLLASTTIAFLISELSFYLLSGRYDTLSWADKFNKMLDFYPIYIQSTLIYGTFIFATVMMIRSLFLSKTASKNI